MGVALLLASISVGPLTAQAPAGPESGAWLTGASVGVPGFASDLEPELFTVGVHTTRVEPGRLGGDFAVGTMPRILVEGVVPLGARAGLALPLALSKSVLFVPSAGASAIAAFGVHGGFVEPGLNVGAAALVVGESSPGLRAGLTWHRFWDSNGAVLLLEFGLVGPRDGP